MIRKKDKWHLKKKIGKYYISATHFIGYYRKEPIYKEGIVFYDYETYKMIRNILGNFEIMIFRKNTPLHSFRFKYRTICEREFKKILQQYDK